MLLFLMNHMRTQRAISDDVYIIHIQTSYQQQLSTKISFISFTYSLDDAHRIDCINKHIYKLFTAKLLLSISPSKWWREHEHFLMREIITARKKKMLCLRSVLIKDTSNMRTAQSAQINWTMPKWKQSCKCLQIINSTPVRSSHSHPINPMNLNLNKYRTPWRYTENWTQSGIQYESSWSSNATDTVNLHRMWTKKRSENAIFKNSTE